MNYISVQLGPLSMTFKLNLIKFLKHGSLYKKSGRKTLHRLPHICVWAARGNTIIYLNTPPMQSHLGR
jgi:hypothetical protein